MFVACGLNHKTAPIDVREKVALSVSAQNTVLNSLMELPAINEAAILSTCNRTEIYCDTNDPQGLLPWLAQEQQVPLGVLSPHFYMHHEHHGIRHTLRVASGLDSMMLGEPQILGQMKQAYQHACHAGTIKNNLRQVFQYVFNASKRIRNLSGIGNNPVSIAFAAVQLIGQQFAEFNSLNVFIIGSGEMASLVAKYLHKQGVSHFMVASRSHEKAKLLAQTFAGEALTISDIPQYLSQADVVISATACPLPFITKMLVEQAMSKRQQAPMFFLDLAVPRDIEANIKELSGVHLYNIDDLKVMTEKGMDERRTAAIEAERLIDFELENYIRWHRSLRAKDVICDYRQQMQELAQQELQRAMQKLAAGHCQYNVLSEFSERLLNKLTHAPTVGLRQAAWDNRKDILDLAQYLFNASTHLSSYEKVT
ncbi:glutamyl-tRNA reductase [Legionella oakridgensis]|uniref:Glutamyl-tRNA reductase n=2 Tax=Legionella oakridgensis TaxID=29423 RepID=W0B963_9GAMM|nr:glutamyl-tRNA reductase [Legionella oakridgensis]AHE66385.1 glutamyl-tRNA reductase [Legionella oakridgensis ATCC 33761 = DSM 21215]ETO93888.1 glutamyl-tRNA reductase [Legionella oakridgensis RV-2-2007]KTD44023.1 glutamyl tRNA reductase [Legionella oakridgensis]STY19566.1 glutamyl tRNA reductase [Legionella longbeachae]